MRLYVNGAVDGTNARPYPMVNNNFNPWLIGSQSTSGGGSYDMIAEGFAIFNTIVTASEAADLNGGIIEPTDISGCLGWWKFNEGSGTTIASYPAGNDGSTQGTVSWIAGTTPFTLASPSGLDAGRTYYWLIEQGGNRTANFNAIFKSESAASLQLTPTAGAKDLLRGTVSDDGTQIWCEILKNFS